MKLGMRTPSLKRSISARTTSRAKRAIKKAIIPGYGQRGMGLLHPKRALYNKVYRKTTFSIFDLAKRTKNTTNSGCCLTIMFFIVLTVISYLL